jgi:hypothetical protein
MRNLGWTEYLPPRMPLLSPKNRNDISIQQNASMLLRKIEGEDYENHSQIAATIGI